MSTHWSTPESTPRVPLGVPVGGSSRRQWRAQSTPVSTQGYPLRCRKADMVPLGLNALDDDRRCAYLYIIDIYIYTHACAVRARLPVGCLRIDHMRRSLPSDDSWAGPRVSQSKALSRARSGRGVCSRLQPVAALDRKRSSRFCCSCCSASRGQRGSAAATPRDDTPHSHTAGACSRCYK